MGKLDDLCAIKVMGWKQEWQGYQGYHGREPPIGVMWWKGDMQGLFGNRYAYINNTTDSLCQPVVTTMFAKPWNPSTSLDDALVCLERAFWKDGKKQFWFFKYWKGGYSCGPLSSEWAVTAVEPQIAMCLAALRAMGVPESEIQEAMK